MAKYYVESGTMQIVTDADDAQGAALWAMHRCMEQVMPVCEDDPQTPQQKCERIEQRGADVLGAKILISEKGFGRDDVAEFDTAEVFAEWNQLVAAMTRLERQLELVR